MKITPENTITLASKVVTVGALEAILNTLRTHGSVYVNEFESSENRFREVPTLAEVLFYGR